MDMEWELVGRDAELERARGLVESGIGVALLGPAGVGTSRLLREVLDGDAPTLPSLRFAATEATRSIPFAPFADLLPCAPAWDRLQVFREALAGLRSRVGPRGLLLGVDDAHHLDAGSLALLAAVIDEDDITVCLVLGARSGEHGGDTQREDRLGVIEGFSLPGGDLETCSGSGSRGVSPRLVDRGPSGCPVRGR